jgi:diguanylate cyclase (GGDEF)-like protein
VKKGRKKEPGQDVPDQVAAALAQPVRSAPAAVSASRPPREPVPAAPSALAVVPVDATPVVPRELPPVEDVNPPSAGTARTVESMLQEFSGGEDVTERRPGGAPTGKYDQLWQLSMADPHTGLANKLLLLDRLTQALARRRRHGGEVAVCHIDLDNLGEINLDLGYTTGNTVLCEGARRLTAILRAEDTVGRVGGSELVVVVAIGDEQDARPLVRRLQQTLEEPVVVGGQRIRMHARLGLALAATDDSAEDVLSRADRSTRVTYR